MKVKIVHQICIFIIFRIYASASPTQLILVPLFYFLSNTLSDFIVFYSESYSSNYQLLSNIVDTLKINIIESIMVKENEMDVVILNKLTVIVNKYPLGVPFLVIGTIDITNQFLDILNLIIGDKTSEEIFEIYPTYIFDEEITQFNNPSNSKGVNLFSSFLYDENNNENQIFFTEYENFAEESSIPNYYNALYSSSLILLYDVLRKIDTISIDEIKKALYENSVLTALGEITIGNDNHILQGNVLGQTNEDGEIVAVEQLNIQWVGDVWRETLNQYPLYSCDHKNEIGDKYEPNSVSVGIIFPEDPNYRRDGLLLVESILTATEGLNLEYRNGNNVLMNPIFITISSNITEAMITINNFTEEYNIQAYFGGWNREIRTELNKELENKNKLLFYFYDYEGDECLRNVFYICYPYSSFFMVSPWLVNNFADSSFVLVFSRSEKSLDMADKLSVELSIYDLNIVYSYGSTLDNNNFSPLVNFIKRIAVGGAMFISLLEGGVSNLLIEAMVDNNLSPPSFSSISFDLDLLQVNEEMEGHYIIKSSKSEGNTNSNFLNYYSQYFTYRSEQSSKVLRPASLLKIFFETYYTNNFNSSSNSLREILVNTDYTTPLGNIKFGENQHSRDNLHIVKIVKDESKSNGFSTEVNYYTSKELIPYPYQSFYINKDYYQCVMKEDEISKLIPQIKVGLLFSLTGSKKEIDISAFNGAMTGLREVFDNRVVYDYILSPVIIDYSSTVSNIDNLLKKYDSDNMIAILGCTDSNCKDKVQEYNNKKLFLYPKQSLGQECNYYTIYTGSVPNQYMSRLLQFILTLDVEGRVYYVGNNKNESQLFFSIFSDASSGLLIHNDNTDLFINDTYSLNTERINERIISNNNGGVIMVYLESSDAAQFLELIQSMKIDKTKWIIFIMGLEIEELSEVSSDELNQIYLTSYYFSDIQSDSNKLLKNTAIHYSAVENPSSLFLSSYVAIKLLAEAMTISVNLNWDELRYNFYGLTVNAGGGEITLESSHHVTLPFFVAKYDSSVESFVTVYSKFDHSSPDAWSWYIADYTGIRCAYDDLENKGEQYRVNVQRVLLVASITGDNSENSNGIVDAYQLVIDEVNTLGGIKNNEIKGDIFDSQSSSENCIEYLTEYIKQYTPFLVIVSENEECINSVADSTENVLILVLSQVDENICKSNLIIGSFHNTFYDYILQTYINRFYDNYLLIGSNEYYVISFVQTFFEKYKYTLYDKYVYETIDEKKLNTFLNDFIKKNPKSKNNLIIFRDILSGYNILNNVVNELPDIFDIVVLDGYYEIKQQGYTGYEGVTGYNYLDTSDVNEAFKTGISQRLGQNEAITDFIERSYSVIRLTFEAMNTSTELSYAAIQENILNTKFISPEGTIDFGSNQFISRNMYIFKIDNDGNEEIVYSQVNNYYPQAYYTSKSDITLCDFSDSSIGSNYSPDKYTIGLIYSVTGEWAEKEIPILNSILLAIQEINDEKYFDDMKVIYNLYNPASTVDGYVNAVKTILSDKKITYVFGGSNFESYNATYPLFEGSNAIFFYTGDNYDTVCTKNTFAVQKHPSQVAEAALRYIIEVSTSVVFIRSNDTFSQTAYNWLYNRFSNVSMAIIGNIIYDQRNGREFIRTLQTVLKTGGYIINMITSLSDNIAFFNELCNSNLVPPSYTVVSLYIDENILLKVDDKNCMVGNTIIDTYFASLGTDNLNSLGKISLATEFNNNLHAIIGQDSAVTSLHETPYSILKTWAYVNSKLNINDMSDISKFSKIYTQIVSVPSSSIEVSTNNLIIRKMYAATILSDYQLHVAWGPEISFEPSLYDQYDGINTGYFCDCTSNGRYYSDPIYIALIHEKDIALLTEIYTSLVEDVAIYEINKNGGILNRNLIGIHFFPTSEKIFSQTRTIVQSKLYQVIIGCLTANCRDEVSRYINRDESDMLFIDTGRDEGSHCYRKTVVTGTTIAQKAPILFDYIKDIGLTHICIFGNNDN